MFAKYKGVNKTVELTQRNDDSVAVPALQALHKCSANPNGRDGLLRADTLNNMVKLLGSPDSSVKVKHWALAVLISMSKTIKAATSFVNTPKFMSFILERAKNLKTASLQADALRVIANCCHVPDSLDTEMSGGVSSALSAGNAGTVRLCVELLNHAKNIVKEHAAIVLQACSLIEKGRDEVVDAGAVRRLNELVLDKNVGIRRASSGALISLTINEKGKKEFYRFLGCENLVSLLQKENDFNVKQNVVKIVSAMCCYPDARYKLKGLGTTGLLEKLSAATKDELTKAICSRAIDNVNWEP